MSQQSLPPPSTSWFARNQPHLVCCVGLIALVGLGSLGYWKISRPMYRFRLGLDALAKRDANLLMFESQALADTKDFEPHSHLLQGALILKMGLASDEQSGLAAATEHFSKCARNSDTRVPALLMTGECHARARRYDLAEKSLSEVLLIDPKQVDAHRLMAQIYYDVGVMNKAMFHLTQVGTLDANDYRSFQMKGRIQADYGAFEDAIASYDEALLRGPNEIDDTSIRYEMARSLVKRRNYARALEMLSACQRRPASGYRPDDGSATAADFFALEAECQLGLGKGEESRASIAKALESDPDHLASLLLAGNLALQSQKPQEAEQVLLKALRLHPKDYMANFRLEHAYRQMGDTERADEQHRVVEIIQSLKEKFADLHQQAIQEPQNADVRYELGVTARDLNEPELALSWFNAALSIDPAHKKSRQALGAPELSDPDDSAPDDSAPDDSAPDDSAPDDSDSEGGDAPDESGEREAPEE